MTSITDNTFIRAISTALSNIATNPRNMRTLSKAAKFVANQFGNKDMAAAFGSADTIIGAFASLKVFEDIRTFNYEKEGALGLAALSLDFVDFCTNTVSLAQKYHLINLGKAAAPFAVFSIGLEIISNTVSITRISIKIFQSYSPTGRVEETKLSDKTRRYSNITNRDEVKLEKWSNRKLHFKLKRADAFVSIALYTSLIALNILLAVAIFIPGVNLGVAMTVVITVVTIAGLTKLGISLATPKPQARKHVRLARGETAKVFDWEYGYKKADRLARSIFLASHPIARPVAEPAPAAA